jgi:hypothetical protein
VKKLVATLSVWIAIAVIVSPLAAQEVATPTAPIVNIEFILDASGSMGAITDTGETRMEAAKRVLRDVIASIPDSAGEINVGFRIYGHEGDNTEATKPLSCLASDLMVPVEGIDRDALFAALDQAQPVGWTPIALSLSEAGKDFPAAGDDVINAVVLVTDGLETCDMDPVAEAGRLNSDPNVQMITHVIGFGTTPEEQTILEGISSAGTGQLLGANNANELRDALFSVLEELQILVGVGYVGGNAFGLVSQAEPGEVGVVAHSPLSSFNGSMFVVLHNNTGSDIAQPKTQITIRDSSGSLVAAGDVMMTNPFFVRAGGLAIGTAYIGHDIAVPADATYEFQVNLSTEDQYRFSSEADLEIVEAAQFENRIVGTVENGTDSNIDGPLSLLVACFTLDGVMTGGEMWFEDGGSVPPAGTQTFQVELFSASYEGYGCPAFLVAASGIGTPHLP